jgi:ATP-dependent DNA helicase RecQ
MKANLQPLLKQYFGFQGFRPLQEDIILDVLEGKDVFAVLPTGGGKSMCFQLPALARKGMVLVISPLIALMKDQVDSLRASGVPATFLNSSLQPNEANERLRALDRGEYHLLYVAPERVMMRQFLQALERWNINLIAIDEAHCISEWGHDFRPEYRQLPQLRDVLPNVPVLALTATATARVRVDIVELLKLRSPKTYVASFNRPNLFYRVIGKSNAKDQLIEFVKARPGQSGIVYCASRSATESVAAALVEEGVKAGPYHAGLTPTERSRNQEAFIRDNIQVICATIAFGMGINKPDVRFVVHYDLPKNVEGYYQETGRAGRDGLQSECLLLFSRGDAVKQSRFIDEKPNPQERIIAQQQLEEMLYYAENPGCRRTFLLGYFGEKFGEENCGACDNCLNPRESFDATVPAQKLLSCVYRIHQQSGFGTGLKHVVQVLTGAETEQIRKFNHETLSTYGIGKDLDKDQWLHIGRELVRLGLLFQRADRFNVLELTDEGRTFLKERKQISLLRPLSSLPTAVSTRDEDPYDTALFEHLRGLRKKLADEREVPAYVIFSDVTLREIARKYPANEREFARIPGVGEKKLRDFAGAFISEAGEFLKSHPKQSFAAPQKAARKPRLNETTAETLKMFMNGKSPAQIARSRALAESTVYGHLEKAILSGINLPKTRFFTLDHEKEMAAAFARHGFSLANVYEALGQRFSHGLLRIYRVLHFPQSEIKESIGRELDDYKKSGRL